MEEAKVVEKWETAEKVKEKEREKATGEEDKIAFERTVTEVEKEEGPAKDGKGKAVEEAVEEKKKGWFW
jgi:hypothetical protein